MVSDDFKQKVFERFKALRDSGKAPRYAIEIEDSEGFRIPMIFTHQEIETDELLRESIEAYFDD